MKKPAFLKFIVSTSALILVISLSACVEPPPELNTTVAEEHIDVAYGPNGIRNQMDVYLPAYRSSTTPVMIFMHGGYWKLNDKSQLTGYAEDFRDMGFATVSMNYRYTDSSINYVQIMEDIDTAVGYLISHADDWVMSSDHFALLGFSSGGVNAPLYGYGFDSYNAVKAVVSLSGAFDFTDPDFWTGTSLNKSYILAFTSGVDENDADNTYASPANYLRSVPTLIVHGDSDTIVAVAHADNFAAVLAANGIPYNYLRLSSGHSSFYGNTTVENAIKNWMQTYLQ